MELIDCKKIREQMLAEAKLEVEKIYADTGKKLKLVVIQVEGDNASNVYIKNKLKTAEECGVVCEHVKLPNDISYEHLINAIENFIFYDVSCTGIMLQLPLPDHLKPYQQKLLDLIPWQMDVDGLSAKSVGRLWSGQDCITPATAQGVMRLLPNDLSDKNVCVLGRSNLVGKPLVKLLEERNATVTLCHSKSGDIGWYARQGQIIISAIGKPRLLTSGWCTNPSMSQTFIDVGINRDENGKLCGDIDIDTFKETDCDITPVPGGVGLLTTAQLITNVVKAYKLQQGE